MTHRTILTARQRSNLFDLPRDQAALLRHYVLGDHDVAAVRRRKGDANQLGFALQLCAFRWPGRLIQPGELIPEEMLAFVGAQIGVAPDAVLGYGKRATTRYQHSAALQNIYGFKPFEGRARDEMTAWLVARAGATRANVDLAAGFLEELRRRAIIAPGPTVVERLCADALVDAETRAIGMIASCLSDRCRRRLANLVNETVDDRVTRFVWLRRFEIGANSADMNRLLDRLDVVRGLDLPEDLLDDVPRAQIDKLRQQGERLHADMLKKIAPGRRYGILAVSAMEWRARLADAAIETNERILGRLWRDAERLRDKRIDEKRASTSETLKGFAVVGAALLATQRAEVDLASAIETACGWDRLETLVQDASALTARLRADPIDFLETGYPRLRRYAPRFLKTFDWRGARTLKPLLAAVGMLNGMNAAVTRTAPKSLPASFARLKWRTRLAAAPDAKLWEIAVLFELRSALRAGDVWIDEGRKYQNLDRALLPAPAVLTSERLAIPYRPDEWLDAKRVELTRRFDEVGQAAVEGRLANAAIDGGALKLSRLTRGVPEEAEALVTQLYGLMPSIRITDLLLDADNHIGFTEAFTDLRTGAPPTDRRALMTVLLADGVNLGLKKMADACSDYSFWELMRVANWHVRSETYARALAMVIDAQAALPMAQSWGRGETSSSDGQHFRVGAQGEAMNVINARYGTQPGLASYSHVSDQYGPFHAQPIAATAHEAPFVLDGLLLHDSGLRIKEHFTDTGGFTDHVFAVCAFLGFYFAPRIRDLAGHRLYAFDAAAVHPMLRPLVAKQVREQVIRDGWPDMMRGAASMAARAVVPSQYLRKLAAYPKRNKLSLAWREVGRIERTLFTLNWLSDPALQRRANAGLNKGEAHHALKAAINFHRKGEIRDRTRDSQELRIAGMNFLAAVIIYANTRHLGRLIAEMNAAGVEPPHHLVPHVSPLGWDHIMLTGEYIWPRT